MEYNHNKLVNIKDEYKDTNNEYSNLKSLNYDKENIENINLKQNDKRSNINNKTEILNAEHKLNSTWFFWYVSRKIKDHTIPYEDRLIKFAEFSTVEEFFKYYVYLKSATEIERNTDISLFKENYKPLWESCLMSGIIFVRYKKLDDAYDLDLKWEKLLFALVGEQFNDLCILGSTLSIRGRETIIELWFKYSEEELNDKSKLYEKIDIKKNLLAKNFKNILEFDDNISIYFKDNNLSLKDGSTLKNVETINLSNSNYLNKRKLTYY